MKTKYFLFSAFLLFTFAVIQTGCRKNDREEQTDVTSARDNAIAQNTLAGVWRMVGEIVDSTSQLRMSTCATVTLSTTDTVTWPKTLTIDFGTTNCLCADGNNRRGIITAVFTGKYRTPGTNITISLSNYYHNDMRVQGTQTIVNNGVNTSGNLTYNVVVNNSTVTTANGNITWSTNQTREWIAGSSTTLDPWDDVYLLTGSANGRSANGNTFSLIVNTPLRVELGCQYIVSGNITITPSNYSPITFDYGSGACDNQAKATLAGKDYTVTLL